MAAVLGMTLDSRKYRGRGICQHDVNQLGISVNAFILHTKITAVDEAK